MALSVAPSIYSFLEGRYARQLTDRLLLQSDINNLRNYLASQQDVNALNVANATTTDLLNARSAYNSSLQQGLSPMVSAQNALAQGGMFAAPVTYSLGLGSINYGGMAYGYSPILGGTPYTQFTGQSAPPFAGNPSYWGAIGTNPGQHGEMEQFQTAVQLQTQARQADLERQLAYQRQVMQMLQPQSVAQPAPPPPPPPPPAKTLTLQQPQLPAIAQNYLQQRGQPTQPKPYAPPTQATQNPIQPSTDWISRGRGKNFDNPDIMLAP